MHGEGLFRTNFKEYPMSSLQVITAPAKEWIAALNRLTPATTGKKAMPILSMALINPSAGTLRAVGKDVDAETCIDALGEGDPFLISYAWLKDAITSTTGRNRNALVKLTAEGKRVTLAAGGFTLSIDTAPVNDFPEKAEHHTFASHSAVDAAELRDALSHALLAASKDGTYPILSSVHFKSAPHGLWLWATDRYRLVSDLVVGPGNGEESFTVPAGTLRHMAKQFKAGSVYVDSVNDGPVIFRTDDATYAVTLIEGKYPDLAPLFEIKPRTVIDVDRVRLLEAAKVAKLMSDRYEPVTLQIESDGVHVRFNEGVFGPDTAPLAAGELTGDPVEITLNPHYLLEVMSSFKGNTVRIHGDNPNKQFTFMDGGVDIEDDTVYRHMIMTVRRARG